jgi:GDP-L-fucose synthase
LHVDDLAEAALHVMSLPASKYRAATQPYQSHINVGAGQDTSIMHLAEMIAAATGFRGRILTDPNKPDGTPRKLLDVGLLSSLGWQSQISLRDGLQDTYGWLCAQLEAGSRLRAS